MLKNDSASPYTRWWLFLGVLALAIAGLFSLVLVIARTPGLAQIEAFKHLFHQALVVHVDLSVLVWFLAIACMLWSKMASVGRPVIASIEPIALGSFGFGILALTLSPFEKNAIPLMSNYVPVLLGGLFFIGLALIFCGVMLMVIHVLTVRVWGGGFDMPLQFALFTAALIGLICAAAFIWAKHLIPPVIDGQQYYELLFWGGGHTLQLLHTQILIVAWILLLREFIPEFTLQRYVFKALICIGFMAALCTPLGYLLYDITSMEHRSYFTRVMYIIGGIAPGVLSLILLPKLWVLRHVRKAPARALWSCLVASILLFLYGGFLGLCIRGQNVVIPAHYHGSIVAVTIGFMGLAYYMLPRFGYRDVSNWRMAYWQPIIYGGGQWLHISGLAWSGGYGVLRKTPGGMQNLPVDVKAAMGFMGLGGLIAIIGGLFFVYVVAKSILAKEAKA